MRIDFVDESMPRVPEIVNEIVGQAQEHELITLIEAVADSAGGI
jgi:hypothetical protein